MNIKIAPEPDDSAFLRATAAGLSYNDDAMQAALKHRLNEIAMRIETGFYGVPATLESTEPITRLVGERGRELLAAELTLLKLGYVYEGGEQWKPPLGPKPAYEAPELLDQAAKHMRDRAKTYDKPDGERSMGQTVEAFNAVTGRANVDSDVTDAVGVLQGFRSQDPRNVDRAITALANLRVGLCESEGWLLMMLLKIVRSEARVQPHRDSVEDLVAYSALYGEARLGG